jgi:hypothetical protein
MEYQYDHGINVLSNQWNEPEAHFGRQISVRLLGEFRRGAT